MSATPRYRNYDGIPLLSAGFRPFFLAAALWAAIAIPLWLVAYETGWSPQTAMPVAIWHAHEMVYGYAMASVAGFLLTAIPNWTGRLPLQGIPLAVLVILWLAGRLANLFSEEIGPSIAAVADLSFPVVFLAVVAREIIAGQNWRNLPVLGALLLLFLGNLLVHFANLGIADTAELGNRLGIGTLLTLIGLVGGRIVPSFTRNWLAKNRPGASVPAPAGRFDLAALIATGLGLAVWVAVPDGTLAPYAEFIAGAAVALRLARWRGLSIRREPLLLILHLGYGWLAAGLMLLGLDQFFDFMPQTTALHALTVGAIGTMTLAVMTRASLGHTGRPLSAGAITRVIYILITLAAALRLMATFSGTWMLVVLAIAGIAWSTAFGLFAVFYGAALAHPRPADGGEAI